MDRRLAALTVSAMVVLAACGHDRIRTRTDLDGASAPDAVLAIGKAEAAARRVSVSTSSTAAAPTTSATPPPATSSPQAAPEGLPIADIIELFGPSASDGSVSAGEALFLQVALRSEGFDEIADAATPEWLTFFGSQVCSEMTNRSLATEDDFFVVVADVVAANTGGDVDSFDLVAALSVGGAMMSCADRFGFALVVDA